MDATTDAELLQLPLAELLDVFARRQRVPGAGSLAALAVAAAAGVVARGARYSKDAWPEAGAAAAQADALRARATPLAGQDAEAFGRAIEALDEPQDVDTDRRNWTLGRALAGAADVLLQIAAAGADTAVLAAEVAEHGSPELRPDVSSAAVLAEAGARMAAHLVAVNLGASPGDDRIRIAETLCRAAAEASARALAV
jgi:formiminotetrahydrofolate cyclodeaminase